MLVAQGESSASEQASRLVSNSRKKSRPPGKRVHGCGVAVVYTSYSSSIFSSICTYPYRIFNVGRFQHIIIYYCDYMTISGTIIAQQAKTMLRRLPARAMRSQLTSRFRSTAPAPSSTESLIPTTLKEMDADVGDSKGVLLTAECAQPQLCTPLDDPLSCHFFPTCHLRPQEAARSRSEAAHARRA